MRYLQNGNPPLQPLTRLSLALTALLLLAFWVTNFAMYFSRMGLEAASVVAYYDGSELDFRPARSAASMLETTHTHLPMMALVLLLLTHLLVFVPVPRRAKIGLMVFAFVSALVEEGSGWLVRFVSPDLAFLKVAAFVALQSSLAVLLALLLGAVLRPRRGTGGGGPQPA